MEKIEFSGLKNCYRFSNDTVDLVAATEIGPNILRFGFVGDRNEFCVNKTDWGYGAHSIRHAPEALPRYFPEVNQLAVEEHDKFIRFTQTKVPPTGIKKEMDIPISIKGNHISIVHRLYNCGLWPIKISTWATTQVQVGGRSIFPLPPRFPPFSNGPLLPSSNIAIWCYCDLSDQRLVFGKKYVILKQDDDVPGAYKLGLLDSDGWLAYYNNGHLFVIIYDFKEGAIYPDNNSPAECFTTKGNFELETLAPLVTLPPGGSEEQIENWFLFRDVPEPKNDDDIDNHILPLIKKIKKSK